MRFWSLRDLWVRAAQLHQIAALLHAPREAPTLGVRIAGCNFCQELARDLQRQVLPKLRDAGYKLYLVSPPMAMPTRPAQVAVYCLITLPDSEVALPDILVVTSW